MVMPWELARRWADERNAFGIENARVAAVACSRARVERLEIELYVEELTARRRQESRPA